MDILILMHGASGTRVFRLGHSLAVLGVFLSLLTLTFSAIPSTRTVAFGTGEVAALSNQYRAQAGLPALTTNGQLTSSAQAKANDMASGGYFAHNSPDGKDPWYFFAQAGYSYITAGENLALTNQSATSVVDGWYKSPGHRANMLSSSYTEVGYGISFVSTFTYNGTLYNDVYLVAAHYAKPPSATPAVTADTIPSEPAVQPQIPAPTPEPEVASTTAETTAPTEVETPQEPIAEPTASPESTSVSGTMAVTRDDRSFMTPALAYGGLGVGATLVVAGFAIEFRRFKHHQPLLPHHR